MSDSIVQFARDFEKFKAALAQKIPVSIKCRNFEDIWSRLVEFKNNPQFAVYFDEYKSMYRDFFILENLKRIDIDRLGKILKIANEADIADTEQDINFAVARLLFFVGDIVNAVKHVERSAGKKLNIDLDDVFQPGLDEYGLFDSVYEISKDVHPGIHNLLKKIKLEWDKSRESVDFEGAKCLLVEKNNRVEAIGGKIETLSGPVATFDEEHKADELSFNEQLKTPDDKFVGVIYRSFEAVRKIFKSQRQKEKVERFYHAHFHLEGTSEEYTGDSIGLAAALLTYIQLLKPDTTRHDKYITSNAAFTGSIDSDGNIFPVNEDTLKWKIEAAFFSPIKYVVLPSENTKMARPALASLNRSYPHRKLQLVDANSLYDVITDRNIIHERKLPLFTFLVKKSMAIGQRHALAYTIMLFLIGIFIGWFILAQLAPKLFDPWFDWRISTIKVIGNRYQAINPDGAEIFKTAAYPQGLADFDYSNTKRYGMLYTAFDFDQDGRDELVVVPVIPGREILSDVVDIYDYSGNLITRIKADTVSLGIGRKFDFQMKSVLIIKDSTRAPFILTQATSNSPALVRIFTFDLEGKAVSGPYLHKGHFWRDNNPMLVDIDHDSNNEIINFGTNNIMERAGLVVLNPWDMSGMSPPYNATDDPNMGSQLYYIAFPETPISEKIGVRNWASEFHYDSKSDMYYVRVKEALELHRLLDDKIPEFIYSFDRDFTPLKISPIDASDVWYNRAVNILGIKTDESFSEMLNRLPKEVIVYQGDSIIYPAQSK